MRKMRASLRLVGRRIFLVTAALVLALAQNMFMGVRPVTAVAAALTYIDSESVQQLQGFPLDKKHISVRNLGLAVVGDDGHVYTKDGMVAGLSGVEKAYVSPNVGYAIKDDGTLWSWGGGELIGRINDPGDTGENQDDSNPGQVTGLPQLVDIQIGERHALALDINGNVWSWGKNDSLQLGTDETCPGPTSSPSGVCATETRILPQQVQGVSNAQSISAGTSGSVALMPDGTFKFWGSVCWIETTYPYYGLPITYPGITDVKQVLADDCSLTYLKNDGTVYSQGFQGHTDTSPRQVEVSNIESINTGGRGARIARDAEGRLFRYEPTHNHSSYPALLLAQMSLGLEYFAFNQQDGLPEPEGDLKGGVIVPNFVSTQSNEVIYVSGEEKLLSLKELGPVVEEEFRFIDRINVSPDGSKIALHHECNLYTARRDGDNIVNLTQSYNQEDVNICAENATWSPDGSKLLVFYSREGNDLEEYGIGVMNVDGSNLQVVIPGAEYGRWSPDGSKIVASLPVFTDEFEDGTSPEVVVANADGSDMQVITDRHDSYEISFVDWSPDGNKLALSGLDRQSDTHRIMVSNVDGTSQSEIYATDAQLDGVAWSPDSSEVAILQMSDYSDNYSEGIVVANEQGYFKARGLPADANVELIQWLTDAYQLVEETDAYPNEAIVVATNDGFSGNGDMIASFNPDGSFYTVEKAQASKGNISPDGSKLSYSNDCAVYVSDRDGSNEVNLTSQHGGIECAERSVWSPDGSKFLVFVAGENQSMAVMNADGTDLTMILPGVEYAGWSPDANKVVFARNVQLGSEGRTEVVALNLQDMSEQVILPANLSFTYGEPTWSPDGTRIAYTAYDVANNTYSLQTVNADSTNQTTIYDVAEPASISFTAWSADSTKVATIRNYEQMATSLPDSSVMIASADGSGVTLARNVWINTEALQWWQRDEGEPADTTPPTLGTPEWSLSVKPIEASTVLTVPVSEDAVAAEYFIGDDDPGQGEGAEMQVANNEATAILGDDFETGVYKINVRAQDAAENWSDPVSDYLVVYDVNSPRFKGKRVIIPSLSNGDNLPGLIAGDQDDKAKFGFTVKYNDQGQIHANSDFQFSYQTGTKCKKPAQAQNCHETTLNATSIEWLTTQGENNSTGVFQGVGSLDIDGTVTTVKFRVTGVDGILLSPEATDQFQLHIFDQNANPNTDTPIYRVNMTTIERGNIRLE